MATKFRALSAPVDASTGDRRRFAADSLTHQALPMPLRWVREDVGGHDGAVTIGSIQKVEMADNEVWVSGTIFDDVDRERMPRLAEDVAEAMKLISEGVLGLSVDLDDFDAVPVKIGSDAPIDADDLDEDAELEMLITKGRIRAATLVDIPAYVETNHTFELVPGELEDEPFAVVAAVEGDVDLPVTEREHPWDGPGAASRVFEHYTNGDNVDTAGLDKAFLYRDPEADPTTKSAYKLPIADVVDGQLQIVPRGVAAAAGGRGVDAADIPEQEKARIKSKICTLYGHIQDKYEDWPDCPFGRGDESSHALVAALAQETLVPFKTFNSVKATKPTPMTYDFTQDPPLAYGHVALWGTCHEGFKDNCVLAPRDPGEGHYREFHQHRVETDEGTVYAGRITAGGRHPAATDSITAHGVRKHHDAMATVAYVRAVEDQFGLFVCGPISEGLDDKTLRILSRRKVSGDWRETVDGLSLIEILALAPGPKMYSEPGFPVKFSFMRGRQVGLCAALGPEPEGAPSRLDIMAIAREVASALKEDQAREAEEEAAQASARAELDEAMKADAERERVALAEAIGG